MCVITHKEDDDHLFKCRDNQRCCVSGKVQLLTETGPQPPATVLLTPHHRQGTEYPQGTATAITLDCEVYYEWGKSSAQLTVTCHRRRFVLCINRSALERNTTYFGPEGPAVAAIFSF